MVRVAWAGDDKLLLQTQSVAGGGFTIVARQAFYSVLVIDVPTKSVKAVFKGSNSVLDAVFGWFGVFKIDGRWVAFLGGVPLEKLQQRGQAPAVYPDLYRVDLDTLTYERVARAGGGRTFWVISPDGSIAGHSDYDFKGKVQTIYAGDGTSRPLLSRQTTEGKLSPDGLGRTPGSLLVADRTSGEELARELRPGGPQDGEVLYTGVEAERTLRDPLTRLLVGVTERGAPGGVRMIDPELQKRVIATAKAFPGAQTELTAYSAGLVRMVAYTESPTDSGTYWLVDIDKKSARPIGSARPTIKAEDLGPVSLLSYKASDGQALDAVLTLPPKSSGRNLALVVMPHDGPFRSRDEPRLDLRAQAFASRGYAVLQPNYRGTLGYGEAFRKAAEGEVGRKLQTDISDAVGTLASSGVVDPKRVCIVGEGYGAYAALAGVTLQKGVYRCAIGRQGVYDLATFDATVRSLAAGDLRFVNARRARMGPVDGEDLKSISPALRAEQADAPVLLIREDVEGEDLSGQSRKMERELRGAGKAVEVFVEPDPKARDQQGHSDEDRAKALLAATVAFVEKNNPPN